MAKGINAKKARFKVTEFDMVVFDGTRESINAIKTDLGAADVAEYHDEVGEITSIRVNAGSMILPGGRVVKTNNGSLITYSNDEDFATLFKTVE